MVRAVSHTYLVSHQGVAIEDIEPRGRGFPFLKLTFTSRSKRWAFTRSLNATKGTQGYVISPIEPREVSGWLPGYKHRARENILYTLNAKEYHMNDADIVVFMKWKYCPFHFVWQIRCQAKDISINIHNHKAFHTQITPCKTVRKTQPVDLIDREEASTGATIWTTPLLRTTMGLSP